jgi:hypothetical protein
MSEHTKLPWIAASKYSSVVGVPIVNQQGKRIANTALPDLPPAWDHMKRQAEIDAAFIITAVNNHKALVQALEAVVNDVNEYERINRLAPTPGHVDCWDSIARAKAVLADLIPPRQT